MSEPSIITSVHHVSLLVTDIARAGYFYINILGLERDNSRPEMAFPGMWLKLGSQQIHLLSLGVAATGTGAEHPGRDSHFAVSVNDIGEIKEILDREEIPYHMSKSGRKALFCRDPDGNGIEFIEIVDG